MRPHPQPLSTQWRGGLQRGCLSILTVLCLAACQNTAFPKIRTLFPLEKPVLFARYESLPMLLRIKPGRCANAIGFRIPDRYRLNRSMDYCGPTPTQEGSIKKSPWLIPAGVKSFHWEEDIEPGDSVQLELTDSDGVLWPSKAEISQKEKRLLIELKPTQPIQPGKLMILTARDKSGTFSVPFKISGA